ncbi:MAG: cyclohydrolase FolE [Burkholderiales bacterium]|jgi:GTP cyclohydrolase I|nr:cyclohydrolase FolE [Burkholderiales bacterium]
MYSKDPELGLIIHKHLMDKQVESPAFFNKLNSNNFALIEQKVAELLEVIGMDLSDASVADTPKRTAKFFINDLFYGLDYNNFPKMTTNPNNYAYHRGVFSEAISFNSTCEHHMVAISGHAYLAYIPKDKIIGLSKLNRVVDFFAKRPQVQERVTRQIFYALQKILSTEDIAIGIKAKHHCIAIRGVRHDDTKNMTVEFGGQFASNQQLQTVIYNMMNP